MKISVKTHRIFSKILSALTITAGLSCSTQQPTDNLLPRVVDRNLELLLFASDPDIVTPIGIAIDSMNTLYVLESHTHQRPKDYAGPEGDVIKTFTDQDDDGNPDDISVFADGFKEGLALAFSPEGILYLVTSRQVIALYDHDGDGKSDEQKVVVSLEKPAQVYAHAALLSLTFSHDNWMYVARGNTGSEEWKLVGSDGSTLSGYGDGGNIFRARPDGSHLEEMATGFWNPADIKFDDWGRLFAADNDPDSRGPNRMVHVVPGGDYGYKSLYGGSGIHPYLAWNGELPHTLPFAVGLGEAPSGLLNASIAGLPEDYAGEMLCTIWEESRIVRISSLPNGASVSGETKVIIEGDQEFRPVSFAADQKGNIYFTDWVLRDYANHGKGKIWRLRTRSDVKTLTRRRLYERPLPGAGNESLHKIFAATSLADYSFLKTSLNSDDPYVRHATSVALSRPLFYNQLVRDMDDPDPDTRLGILVALFKSASTAPDDMIIRRLNDPDERVRQMALIYIGTRGIQQVRKSIDNVLMGGDISPQLFETYLATVRHLQPAFIDTYRSRSEKSSKSIERVLPPSFIENFIRDGTRPVRLRAIAMSYLEDPDEKIVLLTSLLSEDEDPILRIEAVRSLSMLPDEEVAGQLLQIALQRDDPPELRAEALLALSRQPRSVTTDVIPLLDDDETDVRIEALRYMRAKSSGDEWINWVDEVLSGPESDVDNAFLQQARMARFEHDQKSEIPERPTSIEEWQQALAQGGDPARGRRVFYSTQAICSSCHAVQGRGGDLGPDLSNAGQSKSRTQLVQSVLRPSEEISPEWQGWFIELNDGKKIHGRQIDIGGNSIEIYTETTEFVNVSKNDVANFGMVRNSLMPDGLEARLTVQDLKDLISFLENENKH